eukprot:TRINITY_DN3979_c0_g1_i1.p4 TRINITY_DN3979_c0_g1~~TRINITY_DN3979_c0_g1_i1.p4  ORF type:complete len:124 (-),score=50.49 TRINITY_DN3979_c0_g1_i1:145-516(-)
MEDKSKSILELEQLKTKEEFCLESKNTRQLMCNKIMGDYLSSHMGAAQFVNERQKLINTHYFSGTNVAENASETAASAERRFRVIEKRYERSRHMEKVNARKLRRITARGNPTQQAPVLMTVS